MDSIETTELTIIPKSAVSTIIAGDENDILGKLAEKVRAFKPDVSTVKGRREIASLAAEVASSKMDLVRLANGMMEADRKRIAAILAERKIIEDRMDELKVQVRQSLTDFENMEKARVKGHEDALARLAIHPDMERETSKELSEAIRFRMEPEARNWQEFYQRAIDANQDAIRTLIHWRDAAQQREEIAAELAKIQAAEAERQRLAAIEAQKEREARIAAHAAEQAKQEAEQRAERERRAAEDRRLAEIEAAEQAAERERHATRAAAVRAEEERDRLIEEQARARREAEHGAERERQAKEAAQEAARIAREEAIEQQRRDAKKIADGIEQAAAMAAHAAREAEAQAKRREAAAIEAERQRVDAEQMAKRIADEKRAANIANQRKINGEIVADLMSAVITVSEDTAKAIVVAIAKGNVRNVRIEY